MLRLNLLASAWANLGPTMQVEFTKPYLEEVAPEPRIKSLELIDDESKFLWADFSKKLFAFDEDLYIVKTMHQGHPIDVTFEQRFSKFVEKGDRAKTRLPRPIPDLSDLQERLHILCNKSDQKFRLDVIKAHINLHEEMKAAKEFEPIVTPGASPLPSSRKAAASAAAKEQRERVVLLLGKSGSEDRGNALFTTRTALERHSGYCSEALKTGNFREYGASRTPALALFADDAKYDGMDMSFFGHLSYDCVSAFVAYLNEEHVRRDEKATLLDLLRTERNMGVFDDSEAALRRANESASMKLMSMETQCRARVLAALEARCEEEVRRVREAHALTVQTEMYKLRGKFTELEQELSRFFSREHAWLSRARQKLVSSRLAELKSKADILELKRVSVLPDRLLPRLLLLANDLRAVHLQEDVTDLLSLRLPSYLLENSLQAPQLSPAVLRELVSRASNEHCKKIANEAILQWGELKSHGFERVPESKQLLIEHFASEAGPAATEALKNAIQIELRGQAEPALLGVLCEGRAAAMFLHWTQQELAQRDTAFRHKLKEANTPTLTVLKHELTEAVKVLRDLRETSKRRAVAVPENRAELELVMVEHELRERMQAGTCPIGFRRHPHMSATRDMFRLHVRLNKGFVQCTSHALLGFAGGTPTDPRLDSRWYFEVVVGGLDNGKTSAIVGWDLDTNTCDKGKNGRSNPELIMVTEAAPPASLLRLPHVAQQASLAATDNLELPWSLRGPSAMRAELKARMTPGGSHENAGPAFAASGLLWQSDGLLYWGGQTVQSGVGFALGDVLGLGFDAQAHRFVLAKNGFAFAAFPREHRFPSRGLASHEEAALNAVTRSTLAGPEALVSVKDVSASPTSRNGDRPGRFGENTRDKGFGEREGVLSPCVGLVSGGDSGVGSLSARAVADRMAAAQYAQEQAAARAFTEPLQSESAPLHVGVAPRALPLTRLHGLPEPAKQHFMTPVFAAKSGSTSACVPAGGPPVVEYTLRPCISMHGGLPRPKALITLDFQGPFRFPLPGFVPARSSVELLGEEMRAVLQTATLKEETQ